ncbi:Serine/threonine-protein kinase zyg-8 [Bulinus truncatus]|nr:Serine/threonine-protein kinase zyg-8 [Bulinus truncatus]
MSSVAMETCFEDGTNNQHAKTDSGSYLKENLHSRKQRSRTKADIPSRYSSTYQVRETGKAPDKGVDTVVTADQLNAGSREDVSIGLNRVAYIMYRTRRLYKRQVIPQQRLPPLPLSDDEDNSSLSDSTEQTRTYRNFLRDNKRYEEPRSRDASLGRGQQPLQIRQQNEFYEQEELPGISKGRRVMFFRNGDIHFKPKQVLINQKTYASFEKLLVDLSSMVETSTGVKHIFSWPDGREVKSIKDFENGKYYICSSTSKLQRVDYGNSKEGHWKGGKIDRNENFLFQQSNFGKPTWFKFMKYFHEIFICSYTIIYTIT